MFLAESQRQLWCIISHSKKHTLMDQFFFQNPYCWFILEHFWTSLTKPTTLSRDIDNLLSQSTMGMPFMPDHNQEKLHDQITASMDMLLLVKSKLSTSNSFWYIKILKIIQSNWPRVFSVTTQELDFSQPFRFYRFSKVVYHLKSHWWTKSFIKICIADFFQST